MVIRGAEQHGIGAFRCTLLIKREFVDVVRRKSVST